MLRSMFAGVSGLRSHQTMMDVVGNNISNVNTAGYKATRATFQEALTQVVRGASASDPARAGVNPMQLGLGARVSAIDGVFSQGATQVTGRPTDVAVQGEGFFVVNFGGQQYYTRAGAFSFDAEGFLTGPQGEIVQGWMGDPPDTTAAPGNVQIAALADYQDVAIGPDGSIRARQADGTEVLLATLATATFDNPNGLTRAGSSLFAESANSGGAAVGQPGTDTRGALQSGTLEMSNVDLALEFTNLIIAQRGFQANSRTITASDEMLQDLVNLKR
jgi:flagellar hook protein FlgE